MIDATAMAEGFRSGVQPPSAALRVTLERIKQLDPVIGACNDIVPVEVLRRQAESADERWSRGAPLSPLDGVPFGVKANIAIRDLPCHAGIRALRKRIAQADASVVAVMRDAGMLPVSTLNMHEAALGATSRNAAYRNTRNPHDPERIPGGSSGGSAAAVAARLLPITLGTDDLGSVRLPAALCGVVGYKPPFGVLPTDGLVPLSARLDHMGVLAHSVRDIRAVMALFRPAHEGRDLPLKHWQLDLQVEHEVAELTRLPCAGIVDWLDVDLSRVRRAGLLICEAAALAEFGAMAAADPAGFSREFIAGIQWVEKQTPGKRAAAAKLLEDISTRLQQDVGNCLVVSPTVPQVAPLIDAALPVTLADLTAPAAIAGLPAISIPVGRTSTGSPVGLQIMGEQEADVLDAAQRFATRVDANQARRQRDFQGS